MFYPQHESARTRGHEGPQAHERPDESTISRWQRALKFTHGREEAAARIVHWRREWRRRRHNYRKVTQAEWDEARARHGYEEEGFDLETFEYLKNWQDIYLAEEDQTWKRTQRREQAKEQERQRQQQLLLLQLQQQLLQQLERRREQLLLQQVQHWRHQYQKEEQEEKPPEPAANETTSAPTRTASQATTADTCLVVVEPPLTMEAAERTMTGREGIKTSHAFFDRRTSPPTVNVAQVLEIDQAAKREILYHLDAVDPYFVPTFLPLEALRRGYRGPGPRRRSLRTKRAQSEELRDPL